MFVACACLCMCIYVYIEVCYIIISFCIPIGKLPLFFIILSYVLTSVKNCETLIGGLPCLLVEIGYCYRRRYQRGIHFTGRYALVIVVVVVGDVTNPDFSDRIRRTELV